MKRLLVIAVLVMGACGGPDYLDSTERNWETICEAQCLCEPDGYQETCMNTCRGFFTSRACAVEVANCVIEAEHDGTCVPQENNTECTDTACKCLAEANCQ